MLWPLLVEYMEPGVPLTSHLQQQGNMALFLTLFIVTCVEVLIVKVAQSERELEMMLTPHDSSYLSEYTSDDDEDDDSCKVRSSLYEEEVRRQKRILINSSYLVGSDPSDFLERRNTGNGIGSLFNKSIQEKTNQHFQRDAENSVLCNEHPTDQSDQAKLDPNTDTVKVRELIEKMVETLIGGSLDGTTVGQLSTHSAYLDMFTKYHNLLCRELARLGFALHLSVHNDCFEQNSTDLKHTKLKRLMKQMVNEAMTLPNLKEVLCHPKTATDVVNDDFKNKSYEDILATAILNKVIEKFQNKSYKENEIGKKNQKPRLRNKKLKRNDNDAEVKSDGDWSDTSRSDQLSLTIEEYIEEVTTALEVSEVENSELSDYETSSSRRIPFPESGRTVVDAGTDEENSDVEKQTTATELITSTNSWEENWLFQRKRLRSTPNAHHPVPVPMLVPNPSKDYRALVGGVDADDLSDMSECSDSVLEELITTEKKPMKITKAKFEMPHYSSSDEEADEKRNEKTKIVLAHITEESFYERQGDDQIPNLTKNENQGAPNTDKIYITPEKKEHVKKNSSDIILTSDNSPESLVENLPHEDEITINTDFSTAGSIPIPDSSDNQENSLRCRVAEREKEKWLNPVPLLDNPYSLKNIEKRDLHWKKNEYFRIGSYIGESTDFPDNPPSSEELFKMETEKSRFTRDYYVNASTYLSGMPSPALDSLSKKSEQRLAAEYVSATFPEKYKKLTAREMPNKKNETTKRRLIDKTEFSLPSVKELAKQFAEEDFKDLNRSNDDSQTKLESKHKTPSVSTNFPEKEPEVDYSTIPISKIIFNLQQVAESTTQANLCKHIICNHTQPATQMEILRKVGSNIVENHTENSTKLEGAKFNGKQVHSLTARSISKEFREGLKNNSYQKVLPKVNRIGSGGESDQDVFCSKTESSPTPSVDLKNMKKFWEEIITANSYSTKQK